MLDIGKVTVYLGSFMDEFNRVRDRLDEAGIKYKYHMNSHENTVIAPGRGSVRAEWGTLGNRKASENLYEILVSAKDADEAQMRTNYR